MMAVQILNAQETESSFGKKRLLQKSFNIPTFFLLFFIFIFS
jgi:hypothetical protein